jgi:hypothetical protein
MKRIILLFTICFIQLNSAKACSCSGESAFCDINFAAPNHHVFIGKILSQDTLSAQFEVLERIRGVELLDTITIWNFNDTLFPNINCLSAASSSMGNAGDSILIILSKITSLTSHNQHASIGDYFSPSSFCSNPVIGINNGLIIGNITIRYPYTSPLTPYVIDSISIANFKVQFNPNPGAINCDLFVGLDKPIGDKLELTIFPNPSKEKIIIETTEKISSVRIFNSIGAEQRAIVSSVNPSSINISELPSGIYFIEVVSLNGVKTLKKFIKQAN